MPAIQVVGAEAYLAGLNIVQETEECLTHIAQVHHPAHGRCTCYVKCYLEDRGPSKGLVNEVCGYILAEQAGLSVADNPLILVMTPDLLAQMHPRHAARLPRGGDVAVWVTGQVTGQILPADTERASTLLQRWKRLPDLIAFDTWTLVSDRSAGNLLHRRNGDIVVIDHGHLAGSIRWSADLLQPDADPRHPFLALWGGELPDSINQGIMRAAEQHVDCFRRAEPQLKHWTGALPVDSRDTMALLDFLKKRADESQDRMRRILRLLV